MSAPGWARTCTCNGVPFGCYCDECRAWNGGMPDAVAHHTGPRPERTRPESLVAPRTVTATSPEFRGGTLRH